MTDISASPLYIHEIPAAQAARQPDAVCLYAENGAQITCGQLWKGIEATRQWLESEGVKCGHRVMVVGENCPEMITLLFACSMIGAWPVSVNARLSPREIDAICDHADPVLMYFTTGASEAAARHAARLQANDCPPLPCAGENRFLPRSPASGPENETVARAVAALIYTSGTTGEPKGVMVSHRGLLHFARISAASRRMSPADIAYAALPLSHIFGLATVLMATLHAGASLVLRARFDVDDVVRALANPGISILQGVPTMFVRMLSVMSRPVNAPALRYIYTGGAAMDMALKTRAEALFGLPLHHGYGITEYAGSMFVTDIDHPRTDGGAGRAVEGVGIEIRRDGKPVPQGEKGGIHIKGPGVMPGYYRNPGQTAQALLPGGWLDTGDIGYLDAEGVLFITGRSKDIIIRSGFNVYPQEVEAVINTFPGIRLCAVIGVPERDGNEAVIACYQAEAGHAIDEDALMRHVSAAVAPYKRPTRYIAVDHMPTTMSGKIQKEPLRARARADCAASS